MLFREKSEKNDAFFSKFQDTVPDFGTFLVLRHDVSICSWVHFVRIKMQNKDIIIRIAERTISYSQKLLF